MAHCGAWGLPSWVESDLEVCSRFSTQGISSVGEPKGLDLEGIYSSFVKEEGKDEPHALN